MFDRNGHELELGAYVRTFATDGTMDSVLGRVVEIVREFGGEWPETARVAVGWFFRETVVIVMGLAPPGSLVIVRRWKDGLEFISPELVREQQPRYCP